MYEQTLSATADDLWAGLQAEYIVPLDDSYKFLQANDDDSLIAYRFLHDRVQQAAYTLIDKNELQAIHLKIGRLLWVNTSDEDLDEHLFDIIGQLNLGQDLIKSADEKIKLAQLNLNAGQKAKNATAYQVAFDYFQIGITLLPEQVWQTSV